MKSIVWVGSARAAIKAFPPLARREAGHDLWLLQQGQGARDSSPMSDVGGGVFELRVHTGQEHRVFYVAKFEEAIYVLHAFEKRSRKTNRRDLETGRTRYRQVLEARAGRRA